jgi:hypothetical protein
MTYHGPRCTGGPWDPVPLQPKIDALHTQLAKAADTIPAGELSGPGDGGGRERLVKCLGIHTRIWVAQLCRVIR